ncbi:hypothetical protein GCM10007390_41480 [Persicitalea jodogahamensis]|uniref:DUF922 domain-containing protein n=1 Tax=Persicitalea jodogahamensis TaxID=402147 RepID=A0A8J3DCF7_9BACT|nr:hypothetical protein GCM10007390_41480 [Persicitalea jodogahamensis]
MAVSDKRANKPNQLGNIFVYGKSVPLALSQSLEKSLFDHWDYSLKTKEEDSLPLEIQLDEVSVSERKVAPNKIAGEMKVKITFRWTRNKVPLFLTGYSSGSTYTRPESTYDHEALLRRLLDGAIRQFDQWYGLNDKKNPQLARGLKLVLKDEPPSDQADTVFYHPDKKLTWLDFQGKSNRPGSKYAAAVFSSMSYEGNSRMADNYLQATISLKVFMVRSMSWGREEARNTYTLAHEQTHFDITRIIAERFKERLKKVDLTIEDYDSQIQYEFLEAFREMNTEQEKYDAETRHGLNTTTQAAWSRKVQEEISRIYQGS